MPAARTFATTSIAIASVLLAVAGPAHAADYQTRIVRGSATTIEEHPWQVAVRIQAPQGGYYLCGGSIIDSTTVVTAAHCITDEDTESVVNPTYVTVGYGATNRSEQLTSSVTEVTAPTAYPADASFDVARLTLSAPIQGYGGTKAQAVQIATETALSDAITAGDDGFVSGWGTTTEGGSSTPDTLRDATIPLRADADCSGYAPDYVDARNVCAGGAALLPKDTCQGDSGGPLTLADDTLVGITAYGDGCGRANTPGAYTQATNPDVKSVILGAPTVPVTLGSQQPLYGQSKPVVVPQPAAIVPVATAPVLVKDTTRPIVRYSKTTCKKGTCTVRLLAADNSGAVAKMSASVSRKVKKCKRVRGKRKCKRVTKKTKLKAKSVKGGFDLSAKLAKGTYALTAVGTDASGNKSLTLKKTLRIKG